MAQSEFAAFRAARLRRANAEQGLAQAEFGAISGQIGGSLMIGRCRKGRLGWRWDDGGYSWHIGWSEAGGQRADGRDYDCGWIVAGQR